ncbi:MAG: hypothetical protein MR296_02740, partial [Tenericutes bacterium]|nr:hypothetical protein [Mycoplasmatota bacterium]
MFKKEGKLRVGRPKLADSNLKKISLLISAICFVMVIGLIFGGLLDLNIIGNTHKLKAEANTSTLCTSIPDSLKYDENTNPNGFKDVEFFSGVLEHSEISGSNDYVYNDSKYCDTITKEDLEKITHLNYFNNTISSANGIQYLTNLERLNLGTAADIPNYNITSIDLSHNTKLNSVVLSGLLNIKDFDFSNNTELSYIEIGRALYPTSYNINSLIIKNNSKLKTMTNALNSSYGVASILTGSINNLVIENTPNLQMEERVTDLKVQENISLINTKTSLLRLIYNNNNNASKVLLNLKSIYLKDLVRDNFSVLNISNLEKLESIYIDNSELSSLEIKKTSSLKRFFINPKKDSLSTLKMINFSNDDINIKDYKNIYSLTISNNNNLFNFNDIDLSNYPDLEYLTLENLNGLNDNKNIKLNNLNLKEKEKLSKLELSGFDIDSLDLSSNNKLNSIYLNKNNIKDIYLPDKVIYSVDILDSNIKNFNFKDSRRVKVIDSNIDNFDLSNNSALYNLLLVNTDVKKLDLSNNESLNILTVYNNSLNTIYMNKDGKENISDYLKINDKYEITYELENNDVVKIDKDVIIPLKTGDVTIKINHNKLLRSYNKEELLEDIKNKEYNTSASSNIKYPLSEINVHVYDVTSEKYNIDDKTKVIDLKKNNIDLNEIKLGIDSLVKEVSKNKLYIKDASGNIIDEYTLVNKKEEEKENIKEEVKTTTKKK